MSKVIDFEKLFLEEPDKEFHIREIARLLSCAPTTVTKYLEKLRKKEFLTKRISLNHTLYKANRESWVFKNLKLQDNLSKIERSGLIEFLRKTYNFPEATVIFGSFASAEDSTQSDVDVAVVTKSKEHPDLSTYEKRLSRSIQLLLINNDEIIKDKHLANKLINGIVIDGYWQLLK